MKIEGYWKEKPYVFEKELSNGTIYRREIPAKTDYPTPIPNVLSEDEANEIYKLIVQKQNDATLVSYRGSSQSRITGERLGNEEYQTDEWLWPADFAHHYVLIHKVRPTDEFIKWIDYGGY
jgi:hypothetical protein